MLMNNNEKHHCAWQSNDENITSHNILENCWIMICSYWYYSCPPCLFVLNENNSDIHLHRQVRRKRSTHIQIWPFTQCSQSLILIRTHVQVAQIWYEKKFRFGLFSLLVEKKSDRCHINAKTKDLGHFSLKYGWLLMLIWYSKPGVSNPILYESLSCWFYIL